MNKLQTNKRVQLVLLILVSTGLAVGIWAGLIDPQRRTIEGKKNVIQVAEKARGVGNVDAAFLQKSRDDVAAVQGRLQDLETNMAFGDVYRWVIRTFSENPEPGIEIFQIDPPRVIDNIIAPKVPYGGRAFTITGSAYYNDFGRYLANLENKYPHMRLEHLELEPRHPGDSTAEDGEKLNFKMEVFMLTKPTPTNL